MAVTVKKAPAKGKTILNQVIIKAPQRKVYDVGTWRSAIRSADTGRPRELFDLFDDLLLDGYLWDAYNKRLMAVTNSELIFRNEKGEQVPEMADLMDTEAFEDLLTGIMKSRFWGRSGVELDFADGLVVNELPVKHINLEKKIILLNETDDTGISFEKDNHLIVLGKRHDYGVFIRTAPMVIWKRGGFGDYAQWLEIFGMPQRIGKYNSYDPESRRLLEEALKNAGSAPYAVVPKETDIETVTNTGNGFSGVAYDRFRQSCNEEILITTLGQTLTTVQGDKGARALGEVHKRVEEGINMSDMRYTQRVLNSRIRPFLESRGLPAGGGRFVFPKAAEPLSVTDMVQLSAIMPVPVSFLHEKYSIPVPKDGEQLAGARKPEPETPTAPDPEPDPEPEPSKSPQSPGKLKNSDTRPWYDFFVHAPAAVTGAVRNFAKRLTGSITLADGDVAVDIDVASLLAKALKELYAKAGEGRAPVVEKHLFDITNTALQEGIDKTFSRAGLEFGKKNPDFIEQFKYNAAVFSAFKNHKQTREMVDLLHDEKGNLRSFADFRKRAAGVSKDYNQNWLRTEYNTAVRSARSAVNWKQFQMTKDAYPHLEYVKSSAKEKRQTHLQWVGTVLPIDHPWWNTHMPPSDWNCNCSVKRTDKPATLVPEAGESNPLFSNNPGKTAEFVKLKEHPYIKEECPYVGNCDRQNIHLADRPYKPACQICLFAKQRHVNQKRIGDNRKEFERLKDEPDYTDVKFDPKTGGLYAEHTQHNFDPNRGKYEREAAKVLYNYGRKIIFASERAPRGIKTPDGTLDDIPFDIKSIEGTGENNIKHKFNDAHRQGVETVVLYFTDKKYFSEDRILKGYKKYLGAVKNDTIKNILYIVDGKLHRFL
ncbi:MAG: DUF935 family protein [Tannerella sp.]|jgi:hypothetical protein|nr:DUF935 family protein [Tannerella sp.]